MSDMSGAREGDEPSPSAGTNGLAVVALVCGILWGFGLFSVLALIFGAVARGQIRERRQRGKGLATAGVALGTIGIIASMIVALVVAGAVDQTGPDADSPATVQLRAGPATCWTVTLTSGGSGSSLSQTQEKGCGDASYDLGTGPGRRAVVVKTSGPGALTAVVLVDGNEVDGRSTNAELGSFAVSP